MSRPAYKRYKPRHRSFDLFRIFLLIIVIGGFAAGIALLRSGVVNWISGSDWSRIERVDVTGVERLSQRDVFHASKVQIGDNMMKMDIDAAAANVMSEPAVRSARVMRRFPKRLLIAVEERKPLAVVLGAPFGNNFNTNAGRSATNEIGMALIDGDGVLFPLKSSGEFIDLPVINLGDASKSRSVQAPTEPSERLPSGPTHPNEQPVLPTGLGRAVGALRNIKSKYPTLYDYLSEIYMQNSKLSLTLRSGGLKVKTNEDFNADDLSRLDAFLAQYGKSLPLNLEYVDLRFPTMVITGSGN